MAKKKGVSTVGEYKLIMRLDTPHPMSVLQRQALKEVIRLYVEDLSEMQFDRLPQFPTVTVVNAKLLNVSDNGDEK